MVDMEYRIWDANGEAKQMAAVVFSQGNVQRTPLGGLGMWHSIKICKCI